MSKRFLLLWLCAAALHAGEPKRLSFEQAFLFRGEPLLRMLPDAGPWLDDASYAETRDGKAWRVDARSGRARLLFDPAPYKGSGPKDLDWLRPADHSADWSRLVFVNGDDLYALSRPAGKLARLTETAGAEQNPLLSPDGRCVAYTVGGETPLTGKLRFADCPIQVMSGVIDLYQYVTLGIGLLSIVTVTHSDQIGDSGKYLVMGESIDYAAGTVTIEARRLWGV